MLPVPDPAVVFTPLVDGAVLLDTSREQYFGLNGVGARIWTLLPTSRSLDELCSTLATEFDGATSEGIRGDVETLLAELAAAGLLSGQDARAAAAASSPPAAPGGS